MIIRIGVTLAAGALVVLFGCRKSESHAEASGFGDVPLRNAIDTTLTLHNISFHVVAKDNSLTVTPSGYSKNNQPESTVISGAPVKAEIADLDHDNWPELLVYVVSKDDARRGTVVAYSSNDNRSMSPIEFVSVSKDPNASRGYSGHDNYAVEKGTLIQRFPVMENGKATGKTRQVEYKLYVGEENVMRVAKITEQ
jgi:hypothetical protein